jgi:polyhydroxyalkanoate synthesis regulator phasin
MGKLADEIAKQSALVDEKLNRADLSLQQARTIAELAYVVAVQCQALDLLIARLEALEKKVKKLQKADEPRK